ncbi:MAG: hydrogenase maturation protease [Fervidicoccaceae archaeon]
MKELQLEEFLERLKEFLSGDESIVACVGTELRSDDAVALKLCEILEKRFGESRLLKCYGGLESCSSEIIERRSRKIAVVDAFWMETVEPGKVFLLSPEDAGGGFAWSHRMPFRIIIDMLRKRGDVREIALFGISCSDLSFGEELSAPLKLFLEKVERILEKG